MTITELRQELGLTMEAFARELGLRSKGYVSQIECGEAKPSARVALRIEELSGGRIQAATLNRNIALIEQARRVA